MTKGLLDYYRQFDDVDEQKANRELRERRARERALALEQVPVLDLSSTEWPDLPNSEIVNASIYAARGRVNGYPDRHADEVRALLAERHEIEPEQIVVGNGAAELLQSAAQVLLGAGDTLVMPWPSYPLYPFLAQRAGAKPLPVPLREEAVDPEAVLEAVSEHGARSIVLCNPNDPTGTYLDSDALARLLAALPEHVDVLLDEAYVQFQDVEPEDACLKLVEAFPRLLVFRTFSKIYGLSGLRAGYLVGSRAAAGVLTAIAPALGVNVLTQAGMAQALRIGGAEIERRRVLVGAERARLEQALGELAVEAPPSQANYVWLRAPGLTGAELVARLERAGVLVAPGGPLGADDHVRASIRGPAATDRLISALDEATAELG
ncbi:MAG: histidinol-phosphate transaminase [Thermoleophilaceae bacterium]